MEELLPILITAILAPLIMKLIEFVLNKSSEQTKAVMLKITALEEKVTLLTSDKMQLQIKVGVLEMQVQERDRQISAMQREIDDLRNNPSSVSHPPSN